MLREIIESIREVFYPVFGNFVYEVSLKKIALVLVSLFAVMFAFFLYRLAQKFIFRPLSQNKRVLDQIAMTVADNRRLLKMLTNERSVGETDDAENKL